MARLASQGMPARCVDPAGSCEHIPIGLVDIDPKGIFTFDAGGMDVVYEDRFDQQNIKTLLMGKTLLLDRQRAHQFDRFGGSI